MLMLLIIHLVNFSIGYWNTRRIPTTLYLILGHVYMYLKKTHSVKIHHLYLFSTCSNRFLGLKHFLHINTVVELPSRLETRIWFLSSSVQYNFLVNQSIPMAETLPGILFTAVYIIINFPCSHRIISTQLLAHQLSNLQMLTNHIFQL